MTADDPSAESYSKALAELEAILGELEAGDADIDVLAARVERAAELVRVCRDRLDQARTKVNRVVADLDDDATGDAGLLDVDVDVDEGPGAKPR